MKKQSIISIYTGNGKGKTSSGLGMIFRAMGHGQRCGVIQFIKHNPQRLGEYKSAAVFGVSWENFGCGFTWEQENLDISRQEARRGWDLAKEWMLSGEYDLILLDEFSYVLIYGWIDADEAAKWFSKYRNQLPNLVLTGRNMPDEMIEAADMVSEIIEIKHHFSQGITAQKGVEF